MSVERQIGFWVAALVVTGLFLFILRDILLPFVAGFALAYLLDPLADRLQRIGLSRLAATLVILVLFVLVFIVALVLLLPFVAHELASFIEDGYQFVKRIEDFDLYERKAAELAPG